MTHIPESLKFRLSAALRQYRHNSDNSPSLANPAMGFAVGYDKDEVDEILDEWFATAPDIHQKVHDAYARGLRVGVERSESPKGLPGVTDWQVFNQIQGLTTMDDDETMKVSRHLANWLNDPNRDAPVQPTMHPDLEYLAGLDPETIRQGAIGLGGSPLFYKPISDTSCLSAVRESKRVPPGKQAFTLAEIEQARRHLAKVKRHAEAATQGPSELKRRLSGMTSTEQRFKELEAECGAHLLKDLDLNDLPDYETWFETHGGEITNHAVPNCNRPATVHELYTHFRARLLDELRQAGVIGEE